MPILPVLSLAASAELGSSTIEVGLRTARTVPWAAPPPLRLPYPAWPAPPVSSPLDKAKSSVSRVKKATFRTCRRKQSASRVSLVGMLRVRATSNVSRVPQVHTAQKMHP